MALRRREKLVSSLVSRFTMHSEATYTRVVGEGAVAASTLRPHEAMVAPQPQTHLSPSAPRKPPH